MNIKEVFDLAEEKGYLIWFGVNRDTIINYDETTYMELCLCQKWLRDEHKIKVVVKHQEYTGKDNFEIFRWNFDNSVGKWERIGHISSLDSYEQALLLGVYEGLKLVK